MDFEKSIRQIVSEELDRRSPAVSLQPVAKFCKEHDLNRVTVWRGEKEGRWKVVRIGRKCFINPGQFK